MNADQFQLAQNRYQEFKTRALNLIQRACGSDSDHYLQLRDLGGEREYTDFGACVGIVEAALISHLLPFSFPHKFSLIGRNLMAVRL